VAAWVLDGDGVVAEEPGYNVFADVDGRLLTPASGVVEGITRRTVMELAELIDVLERDGFARAWISARCLRLGAGLSEAGLVPDPGVR
jgi:branched-subunit amino acid aminotransferase/4-amino-4-deoxychorismate lyase